MYVYYASSLLHYFLKYPADHLNPLAVGLRHSCNTSFYISFFLFNLLLQVSYFLSYKIVLDTTFLSSAFFFLYILAMGSSFSEDFVFCSLLLGIINIISIIALFLSFITFAKSLNQSHFFLYLCFSSNSSNTLCHLEVESENLFRLS